MAETTRPAPRRPVVLWVAAAAFVIALAGALAVYSKYTALQDTDSYYHLALARKIAREGVPDRLEWARMTPYGRRFGDPVLGFHLFLAPFVAGSNPDRGGLVALAVLDAALFAAIAGLAAGAIGWWGLLVPFAVFAGSPEAALRLVRLRPELLAFLLWLIAVFLVGRGRYRMFGAASALFALCYSAVHAWLAVWCAVFLFRGWSRRRWEWELPLYSALGLGLGLIVHPRFPANLDALAMAFRVGLGGAALEGSGDELRPHSTLVAFLTQLGLLGAFLVLWRSRRADGPPFPEDTRLRDALGVLAVIFGALYLASARFSFFAFPFAALWLLWNLKARGETVGRSFDLFGRKMPIGVGLAACALAAAYPLSVSAGTFAARGTAGPDEIRFRDRRAVAALLPPGARVAATWGDNDLLAFYAPWARYLEVLDPLPLSLANPDAHRALLRLFGGAERDVPRTLATTLDSDYLVGSRLQPDQAGLLRRLAGDPRIGILHDGIHLLARWRPGANASFVRPWSVAPAGLNDPAQLPDATWTAYPWDTDPRGRAAEGYIDLERLGEAVPCRVLATTLAPSAEGDRWAIAPAGPTRVAFAGREVLAVDGSLEAVLADGVRFPLPPRSAAEILTVLTCGAREGDPGGFYFWADSSTPTEAQSHVRSL
ncbi:MAG TPA: hypothetical protein VGX68_24370 [Thermoanaerobaculia bacterium]|jgi:hypothetical protein|nr:hypothetical protein [Thermoanaerobaculia bacterium]